MAYGDVALRYGRVSIRDMRPPLRSLAFDRKNPLKRLFFAPRGHGVAGTEWHGYCSMLPGGGCDMVSVKVWLHPVVRNYAWGEKGVPAFWEGVEGVLVVPQGTSVGQVLALLGLAGGSTEFVVLDGKVVGEDQLVTDGSSLQVYPVFGGG